MAYTSEIIGLYLWIPFSLLLFLCRALQTLEISYNISVCIHLYIPFLLRYKILKDVMKGASSRISISSHRKSFVHSLFQHGIAKLSSQSVFWIRKLITLSERFLKSFNVPPRCDDIYITSFQDSYH